MAVRKYFNNRDYFLDENNRTLVLSDHMYEQLHSNNKMQKYKKIGGSQIPNVLEVDNFKTQFAAFCHITRLAKPVLMKKYINAGVILEPKIMEALGKLLKKNGFNDLVIQTFQSADYNYDYFEGKDDVLGGVPDGFIAQRGGIILEAKTVGEKKLSEWEKKDIHNVKNVPLAYRKQAQLYSYLMNAKKYLIVALFLRDEEGDYEDPDKIDVSKRYLKTYVFDTNYLEAQDDANRVKEWYKFYTNTKVSPQWNPSVDKDQVDYLRCQNEAEWQELLEKWKKEGKADLDEN